MRIAQDRRWLAIVPLVVALLTGTSAPARAAEGGALTIGSGLAFSILVPDQGDNLTVLSVPEGNPLFAATPGLRFGTGSASRGFEFGIGTAVVYASSGGESFHILVFGLDFQKHFVNQSNWNLYLGGDVGISTSEFFVDDVTQPYFGAMIGGRNVISDGNGSVKLALHLRHHLEDDDAGADSFNEISFAFHFDLWIPK
jgi:hypothetical protein